MARSVRSSTRKTLRIFPIVLPAVNPWKPASPTAHGARLRSPAPGELLDQATRHGRREQRIARGYLQVDSLGNLLDSYSYENVLARGFALVRDIADRPVTTATAVTAGAGLTIQFGDGEVAATAGRQVQKTRPRASKTRDPRQGDLL